MNPVRNPFAPGAGTRPPQLSGRDGLLEEARIAIERTQHRRPAKFPARYMFRRFTAMVGAFFYG
ncbi:MAG: hypothetical protein ACYCZB_08040 [Acidiphilium sp.]